MTCGQIPERDLDDYRPVPDEPQRMPRSVALALFVAVLSCVALIAWGLS